MKPDPTHTCHEAGLVSKALNSPCAHDSVRYGATYVSLGLA